MMEVRSRKKKRITTRLTTVCDSDKKPLQRHLFIQMRSTSLGLFVYIFQNQNKHYKFFVFISVRVSNNGRVTTERMQLKNR